MSALLIAAAAASFAPPQFTADNLRSLQARYPVAALAAKQSAAVLVDVQVDPKGRASKCKALATYGDQQLAAGICGLVEGTHVQPATIRGQPAHGVVRQMVKFFLPDQPGAAEPAGLHIPADIEVQVNKVPSGTSLRVQADVVVSAAGQPQACVAPGAPAGYGDVACAQVSGIVFGALQDSDGKPVEYVRSVNIEFNQDTA
jgi:hypothetical protein